MTKTKSVNLLDLQKKYIKMNRQFKTNVLKILPVESIIREVA